MNHQALATFFQHIEAELNIVPDEIRRLFHGRGRRWEGLEQLTSDWLQGQLVVSMFKEADEPFLSGLKEGLIQLSESEVWKTRGGRSILLQHRYQNGAPSEILFGEVESRPVVTESGLKYQLDLGRNQNFGLFLDMRYGRDWVRENTQDKKVLNLFAYTCGFSLAAIAGGAEKVVNLDMAKSSLAKGRDNHRLNGHDLSKVSFMAHDIFKSWGKIKKSGPYDLVIIDPPSFQKGSFALTKDYKKILRRLPDLLTDDGVVLACVNSPAVTSEFLIESMKEEAPAIEFNYRLENPPEFQDIDEEASLKALVFNHNIDALQNKIIKENKMENLVDRFLRYVTFDTQSNEENSQCPSSPGQMVLAEQLKAEMEQLGLADIELDKNGYLMAKLPSNVNHKVPAIGFIAHMDTAPDESGKNVSPQRIEKYQGGEIVLGDSGEKLSPEQYPDMNNLIGQELITTDGTTLLGADNKAGIAEILTAVEVLIAHPEIPHGDICIGFTPDEEIGRGADLFNVEKFGAEWAYTIDGGPVGELEFENFNASSAKVICRGVSVHPGTAKDKLVNSMNIAAQFQLSMPAEETPECTQGYEGFYHLTSIKSGIALTELNYIIRDFEREGLESRKAFMQQKVEELNAKLAKGSVELEITDSYFNMKEMVEPHPHIIELAKQSMRDCGIEPDVKPIRGGTDGARLSFMGLPCPNIFTGGYNFHGIHEFISVDAMKQAVEVIVKLAENTAANK